MKDRLSFSLRISGHFLKQKARRRLYCTIKYIFNEHIHLYLAPCVFTIHLGSTRTVSLVLLVSRCVYSGS